MDAELLANLRMRRASAVELDDTEVEVSLLSTRACAGILRRGTLSALRLAVRARSRALASVPREAGVAADLPDTRTADAEILGDRHVPLAAAVAFDHLEAELGSSFLAHATGMIARPGVPERGPGPVRAYW